MRLSRANLPLASEDRTHSQAVYPSLYYNLAPHFRPGFINLQHFCHSRWRNPVRLSKSGQEMGPGHDVRLEEGAEFGTRRRWQHGDPGVAGEEPVLTLHGMAVFSLLVLWRRHLLDRGDDQALVRVGRAASGTCRIAAAADEGLIRIEEPAQRTGRILAQPVAQLVRHGPRRLVRHRQFPLQKFGRDAPLVATNQMGGKKPLRQIRPRPMKNRSRGHRLLPVAGAALVNPRSSLQPPSQPPPAGTTHKTAGPAKPGQVLDAPLLRPKPDLDSRTGFRHREWQKCWRLIKPGQKCGATSSRCRSPARWFRSCPRAAGQAALPA